MKKDAEAAKSENDLTVISYDLMKTLATPIISTGVAYIVKVSHMYIHHHTCRGLKAPFKAIY